MKQSQTPLEKNLIKSLGLLALATLSLLVVLMLLKKSSFLDTIADTPIAETIRKARALTTATDSSPKPLAAQEQAEEEPDVLAIESAAFKEFPHLATSYRLSHKVLKSEQDWEDIRAVHSDRAAIEASANYLTQEHIFTEDKSLAHFRHIDFLKRALSLENNPAEEYVHEKISAVLAYEPKNYDSLDEKGRQVFLGDKIDLIYVMKAYAPDVLNKMLQQSGNKRLEKLVQYAEENRKFLQLVDL